jgi:cytidylate kinase
MGAKGGIVMDGRDIGTVVFPNAELKLYMTASAETRAQRRYKELIDKGEKVTYDEVLQNVNSRDEMDSNRKDSPLVKADDAIEFDNSDMSIEEQFKSICDLINNILS